MSEAFDKFTRLLTSGVENITQSFHDRYVERTARFRSEAGLKTVIVRNSGGKCCDWCADLDGIYTYDNAPKDVFARHANCNCTVSCKTTKGTWQDAWSKKEYKSYKENRIAREQEFLDRQQPRVDFYTGKNGKSLEAKYKEWIGDNKYNEYLNNTKNEEVKKYIKQDYRPTSFIGDGGTADIRKFEIDTGLNCGRNGNNHAQKVTDLIRQINKILLKDIDENDKIFLEKQLKKLRKVDVP